MVNKERVRRIKNLIYAIMILVLLLPVILMVVLSFKILDTNKEIMKKLDEMESSVAHDSAAPSPSSNSRYVIEPEGQSNKNDVSSPDSPNNDVSHGDPDGAAPGSLEILRNDGSPHDSDNSISERPAADVNWGVGGMQPAGSDNTKVNEINIGAGGMQPVTKNNEAQTTNGSNEVTGMGSNHSGNNNSVNTSDDVSSGALGNDYSNPGTGINGNPRTGR